MVKCLLIECVFDPLLSLLAQSLLPVNLVQRCLNREPPVIVLLHTAHHKFLKSTIGSFFLPFKIENVEDVVEYIMGLLVVFLETFQLEVKLVPLKTTDVALLGFIFADRILVLPQFRELVDNST